ncbi:MAG TPA: hypothetical protein VMD74_01200 [Candidatus Methylomirabilis sp.]|nr:hypothetical protein [Candidatus Methylomirabilis sp.]
MESSLVFIPENHRILIIHGPEEKKAVVDEIGPDAYKNYAGITFTGDTVYDGKFPERAKKIPRALLFLKSGDFFEIVGAVEKNFPGHKKESGKRLAPHMINWIDRYVIARRK